MFKRGNIYYTRIGGVSVSLRTEIQSDAEALEGKLKQQRWQEKHLGVKPKKSWEDLGARWAREKCGKITWDEDRRAMRFWERFFGHLKDIREINRERVDEICQQTWEITKEASPQNNTASHYVAYLSASLRAACRQWDWIERYPQLRRYPLTDGRKRWLSVEEWKALESVLPQSLLLAGRFALATGIRRGALVALRWTDIQCETQSLTFAGTSNKLGNTIPLNDTAMSVLEEIQSSPVRHMNLVFTKDGRRLVKYQKLWYKALDQCGLRGVPGKEDVCFHTLRHTFASWLRQNGTPTWALNRLGGWSSGGTVDRYAHLDLDSLRPYSAIIDRVLNGESNAILLSKRN